MGLAWIRRERRQRPGSQYYEEHRRDDFGQKFHTSVPSILTISPPVCDLNHTLESCFQSREHRKRLLADQIPLHRKYLQRPETAAHAYASNNVWGDAGHARRVETIHRFIAG